MDLRLRTRVADELIVIEVGGELELHNAPQLRSELSRATEGAASRIVVDLSGLVFIDSTGIGVLVGGLKKARENGGRMVLVCPTPRIRRVFEITGLMRALPIFETRKDAEAALSAPVASTATYDNGDGTHNTDTHNTNLNGAASNQPAPHGKDGIND